MIQPEHLTPGRTVVGAGVRYEGRKLLPDVDEACEDVAGRDHATGRRGRPHHDRHVVPQLRRGRRALVAAKVRLVSGVAEPVPEPPEPSDPSSVPDRGGPPAAVEVCPLCGTPVAASDMRCPSCNRSLAGVGNRPGPFSRRDVVMWADHVSW